jgi:hypothetical protein
MNHPLTQRCPHCGGALFVHEGEALCPDCTSYTLAEPPAHADAIGIRYRPLCLVPYSELTPGTPFALPGETRVYFRAPAGAPGGELSRLLGALYHRPVLLLERDGPDDRAVDLVDDREPPF